jgi:TonB family protein
MPGNPTFAMNPIRLFSRVLLFAALALSALAAFEPARPLPENVMPRFPAAMTFEGITHGRAVIAVSIDAEGRVQETLPLAYSNLHFARVSQEALKEWRYTPARQDGMPVPVQMELKFDYIAEGAVVTSNITNNFLYARFEEIGENSLAYRPGIPAEIDRVPTRISGGSPKYATAAAKDGVQGRVRVRFYIDEQGAVRQPAVSAEAHPYLAEQAVAAVRDWKFEPVTSHGRPVLVLAEQEFDFGGGR